jgi:dihydroorotate dehydrogenase
VDDAGVDHRASASLIQGCSGVVFGGGLWAKHIHDGIAGRLYDAGCASPAEAIGSAVRNS